MKEYIFNSPRCGSCEQRRMNYTEEKGKVVAAFSSIRPGANQPIL